MDPDNFIAVGFLPPPPETPVYRRQDPRGTEYGYYEARGTPDNRIEVTKCTVSHQVRWTATFTLGSFRVWALEHT